MASIQNIIQSLSVISIPICVIILVLAFGGYSKVRHIVAKSSALFAFFAVLFNAKIAMALKENKATVTRVQKVDNESVDQDPWKIVDSTKDEWKIQDPQLTSTTIATISSETSTTTSTATTSTTLPQSAIAPTTSTTPVVAPTTTTITNEVIPKEIAQQNSVQIPQNPSSANTTQTHVVLKGENLYTIAKQYSKDLDTVNKLWVKIISANKSNLISKNANLIYAGESITIPQIN